MAARTIILVAVCFIVAGCTSVQERCSEFGFTPGTDAFAQCAQTESQRRSDAWKAFGQSMQNYSNQQQMLYQQQQMNRPRNCVTSFIGNQAYTNCY